MDATNRLELLILRYRPQRPVVRSAAPNVLAGLRFGRVSAPTDFQAFAQAGFQPSISSALRSLGPV